MNICFRCNEAPARTERATLCAPCHTEVRSNIAAYSAPIFEARAAEKERRDAIARRVYAHSIAAGA